MAWQMAYGPDARASLYDEALALYEKAKALGVTTLTETEFQELIEKSTDGT